MRILLVEDDDRVAAAVQSALARQGYTVRRAANAHDALAAAPADLVLLDLGLPDLDGLEVCRRLHERDEVPIIVVTARGEQQDRIRGLRIGADDYLVKPFSLGELLARIEAVLRRTRGRRRPDEAGLIQFGDIAIDLARRTVHVAGEPVPLTRKEFDILAMLAREPGAVVSRDRIVVDVWSTTYQGASRSLDVHVATLRTKLGRRDLIETVRGVGYRLTAVPAPR